METKIAAELIDELRRRRMTVGTAESCTAGMISAEIADVPGASDVLVGGIVSYANELIRFMSLSPKRRSTVITVSEMIKSSVVRIDVILCRT